MKNRQTAIILALFLGGLGTHWLYVGKHWKALVYLLFCWTFIPAVMALFDGWSFYKLGLNGFADKYGDGNIVLLKTA